MKPDLVRFQLLLAVFAGWVNRQQAHVIDYLVEENRVLKEQLKGRSSFARTVYRVMESGHTGSAVARIRVKMRPTAEPLG